MIADHFSIVYQVQKSTVAGGAQYILIIYYIFLYPVQSHLFLRALLLGIPFPLSDLRPGDHRAPECRQQCASQSRFPYSSSFNLGGKNPNIKKKHNETFQNDIYNLYVCIYIYNMILVKRSDLAWFGRDLAWWGFGQPQNGCVKWSNIWYISLGAPLLYWLYSQTQNSTKQLRAEKTTACWNSCQGSFFETN